MAIYLVVPETGGEIFYLPMFIAGVLGFFAGGFFCWQNHGDVLAAAMGVGMCGFFPFKFLGEWLAGLAPASTALYVFGAVIEWVGGIYFGLGAGLGALFGAGAVWVVMDIVAASQKAAA